MDYVDDYCNDDNDEDVIGSGTWLGALLCCRFELMGLCGYCHAVFQIGAGYGLLFTVVSDV